MTTTNTPSVIKVSNDKVLSGDVFYGSFDTVVKDKRVTVGVSNHLKDPNKQYKFRIAGKCQAGFINIHDTKGTPSEIIRGYTKNSLVNIQVEITYEEGRSIWLNVYTTKGGKWFSIDKGFLETLTVGTMRESFPDMCDMNIWSRFGAKTWADKAFTQN